MSRLGRRVPPDFEHVTRFPLTLSTMPSLPVPVNLGVNWYRKFMEPEKDSAGRWWIGRGTDWGPIVGGHAICMRPEGVLDSVGWWKFYDQGNEGACVGFSLSRVMSLLNRLRYAGRWLYKEAQKVDDWPGENYDGTSMRAGADVLVNLGHRRVVSAVEQPEQIEAGVSVYRWATSVDDILLALARERNPSYYDRVNRIPLLNSWGKDWPHVVWMPTETIGRLLGEEGEACIVTDR